MSQPHQFINGQWVPVTTRNHTGVRWRQSPLIPTSVTNIHREDPRPYALPTAPPWNPPVPCQIPTYEGSGQTTHPAVVDMVHETGEIFNGYRFWMCHTPYPFSQGRFENPSIVASNNGWDWHDPYGIVNPVVPAPPDPEYLADGDLEWNPELSRFELIWKHQGPGMIRYPHIHSYDGITWTQTDNSFRHGGVSPALVRMGPDEWRAYLRTNGEPGESAGLVYVTAPTPEGPWDTTSRVVVVRGDMPNTPDENLWHWDCLPPDEHGIMRGIASTHTTPTGIYVGTSIDGGETFTFSQKVIAEAPGQWDSYLYRPTMTPHEDGKHMRVWYGALRTGRWAIGYTQLPLSLWPTP